MIPRASLLAVCLFWMAHESHYSTAFFVETVCASLGDMQAGLNDLITIDLNPA